MHTIEISKILQLSNPKASKVFAWIPTVAYHPYLAVNLNPVFKAPDTGRVMIYQLLIHIDCLKIVYKENIEQPDIPIIKQTVEDFLVGSGLSLDEFTVARIDYCYNAVVSDEERKWLLPELQKLPHRRDYQERVHDYKTSVYYQSKSRVTQFYDKEAERFHKGKLCEDYEVSVLRLEAQIKHEHIKYKKRRKKNWISNRWDDWVSWDMQRTYLVRSLNNVIYTGDYHTLDSASAIIRQHILRPSKQNNLIGFLQEIHEYGWDKASVKRCYNTNRCYAKKLTEMNINPILLPDNSPFQTIKNLFLPILNL